MKSLGGDFWSGLALGSLGAYIVFQASRWEYIGNDGPGPGFFPLWYGIAMLALSLALMVTSFKQAEATDWKGAGRAFGAWAALVATVAALKFAGFLICFTALTFFVAAVMYRRPLGVAAGAAVAAAAVFYVIFPFALGVKLP
jgi:putative tricarboxylic transport membrane protein